jgi:hypothetical protein
VTPDLSGVNELYLGSVLPTPIPVIPQVFIEMKVDGFLEMDFSLQTIVFHLRPNKICQLVNLFGYVTKRDPGSSVGIVSGYGLYDRGSIPGSSEAQPGSCTIGTGGPLPVAKRGRGVALTTHPYPRSRMSRSYTSSPPKRYHRVLCFLY